MSVESLKELLLDELRDLYSAEKQIIRALPKMAGGTSSPELRKAFETHLEETKGHVQRLEQIFELMGKPARAKICHGMQGVLEEGFEMLEDAEKGYLRDAGLNSAAQRVEHYEMAAYGCVRNYAELLGLQNVAKLLDQTLAEEKAIQQRLATISERVPAEQEIALGRVVGIPDSMLTRPVMRSSPAPSVNRDQAAQSARISALAQDIFGSPRKASVWLRNPNLALGGQIPLDLLDTDSGIKAVETVLGHIEFGLYS